MVKGKKIGAGATAEVYEWGENEVIKFFYETMPIHIIDKEYNIASLIQDNTKDIFKSPKIFGKVSIENRTGIIYERFLGVSMINAMMAKPWLSKLYARKLAQLQFQVHSSHPERLPSQKDSLKQSIELTDALSDKTKSSILGILEKLPEGDVLCHGDFHPDNILINSEGETIIDWMTGTMGNPAGDVARSLMILKSGVSPEKLSQLKKTIIKFGRNYFSKEYLKEYIKLSGIKQEEIKAWELPILAGRIFEVNSGEEKIYIIERIEKLMIIYSISSKKIIWMLFNTIIITLDVILNNSFSAFIPLISFLSIPFLYGSFLISFKDFLKKKMTLKALYKEYSKVGNFTLTTLKIVFQMFYGLKFVLEPLLRYKLEFSSLYRYPWEYSLSVLGVYLLYCSIKNILKFES
ncbi:MAG TPA: aminoglycoside phosphotransferase family protein [Clostridiaceae bacterium]